MWCTTDAHCAFGLSPRARALASFRGVSFPSVLARVLHRLRDFGTMPFLDKFVFKNPKSARRSSAGHSIMQPTAVSGGGAGASLSEKNSVARLLARPIEKVAADERFFHAFFKGRKEADERKRRGRRGMRSENSDEQAVSANSKVEVADDGYDELGPEGDAFATRLAKSIMRDEAMGDDDDDFFDDDDDDDDDDGDDDDDDGEEEEGDDSSGGGGDGSDDHDDDGAHKLSASEDGDDRGGERSGVEKKRARRKGGGPTFADASEFAEMLEAAGNEEDGVNKHLAAWERGHGRKSQKRKR